MCRERGVDLKPLILLAVISLFVFSEDAESLFLSIFHAAEAEIVQKNGPEVGWREPDNLAPFNFEKININTANLDLLMTVKGVGPSLAAAIVDYRRVNGPIENISDLLQIPGVGQKRADYLNSTFRFD